MTHADGEDGEKEKTTEEEIKDPRPLDFLSELVTEENLSPEVATSYRKLARTLANQFCREMKSCVTFVRSENQETQDIVTKEMVEVAKAFKEAQEAQTERTQLEMEQLRLQLRGLEEQLQQRSEAPSHRSEGPKPSKPDNYNGDRVKGKE